MPHLSRLASALALALLAVTAAHAQRAPIAPPTLRPSPSAVTVQGMPNPAGLRSPAPAGLTAGSGGATSSDPNVAGGSIITGVGSSEVGSDAPTPANPAATMGAGAGAGGSRGPSQFVGSGSPGYSAVDIARSFINADGNRDGELSEGEARRLSISVMSFQEMDRNFDGKVSRSEYEDSLR